MSGLNVIKISASLYETDDITVSNVNFVNYLNSVPATTFAFLSGTTSNIQDQINTKASSDSATLTGTTVFTGTMNTVSPATFAFLSGTTDNIQTQINTKAPILSPQFSGTPTAPTAATATNTIQIATTAFVKSQFVSPSFTGTVTIAGPFIFSATINNISAATFAFLSGTTDNIQTQINTKAPILSPQFSGTPTAPTAATATNTIQIATTAFVRAQLASPAFSGTPTAPTAVTTTNTDQLATTAFVRTQLASPAFSGTPTAPTAVVGTNTDQLATTAYVIAQGYAKIANPTFTGIPYADTAAVDTDTTQLATTAFVKSQLTTPNTWTKISTFANTTASTSSTTGALVVAGGAGIAGKLTVGTGAQIIGNLQIGNDNPGGSGTGDNAYIAYTGVADVSVLQIVVGNDTNDHIALMPSGYVGIKTAAPAYDLDVNGNCRVVGNLVCSGIVTGLTASAETNTDQLATTAFVKSQLAINNEWAGVLTIANTTASTSSTTGALVVAGGAGIAGKLTVGTGAQIIGNLQIGNDNPGGSGTGDNAYIAYTGVADVSVLQIVVGNDTNDHIALMPSGYVGIKTAAPAYDLDVNGNCRVVGNLVCDGIASGLTAPAGTSTTQFATTAFVMSQNTASVDSPTFTGIARADTAAVGTNTTQLATTAFVQAIYSLNNTWTGSTIFSNTTASTSSITGAVVIAGGTGIAGNLNVAGNTQLVGNLTLASYIESPPTFAALPNSISGCILWLDANDPNNTGVQPTNGTGITTWVDKSGLGNDATASTAVTYNTTGFNGYPAMIIASGQKFSGSVVNTNTTLTIFAVCRMDSSSSTGARILSLGQLNTTDYDKTTAMTFIRQGGTGFQGYRTVGGTTTNNPVVGYVPYLFETWYTGTTNYNIVHQSTSTATTSVASTGSFGITNYVVAAHLLISEVSPFIGEIAEIIIYNTALTTAERQYIEGLLSWKWGLQTKLKSDHPYYNPVFNTYKIATGGTAPTNIAIMPSANVGINTTAPNYTLDVSGNCRVTGNLLCNGTLTGVTAAVDTNTTQVATTAYVINQAYAKLSTASFTGAVNIAGIVRFSSATVSTTVATGALVLTGASAGLGVAGNIWFGGSINSVSAAVLNHLVGVTSPLQSQITAKAPSVSPTLSGVITMSGTTIFTGTATGMTMPVNTYTTDFATTQYVMNQGYALIASPTFTGVPKSTTALSTDDSTQIATTAYVKSQLISTAFSGTPTAPTAISGTNTTQLATTQFVQGILASPAFTGVPTAPNAVVDTNTQQLATTAYVMAQGYAKLASPGFTGVPTADTALSTDNSTQLATTAFVKSLGYAPIASPTFTGVPKSVTASAGTSTDQIATTLFVNNSFASPDFTGIPTAPTALSTDSSRQLATTAFVKSQFTTNISITGILTITNTTPSTTTTTGALVVSGGAGIAGKLTVGSGAQLIGNIQIGISNPGGTNSMDSAYINYSGDVSSSILKIGVNNDTNDHISLMPSGCVGIKTAVPAYDLDVNGNCRITGTLACEGIPTAPTAGSGTSTPQIATTEFVQNAFFGSRTIDGEILIENTYTSGNALTVNGAVDILANTHIHGELHIGNYNPNATIDGLGDYASITYTGLNPGVEYQSPTLLKISSSNDGGSGDNIAIIAGGYVGINTTTPAYDLDINGSCRVVGTLTCSGVATAPTAAVNTNTTQIATTAFVIAQGYITSSSITSFAYAPLASPVFTGIARADTAAVGTNTTQLATTAFVNALYSTNNTWTGTATFTNVTASTTSLTGAVVVAGGIGVTGNLNIGGNTQLIGNLTMGSSTPPFTFAALPNSIAGCILWFDAQDPSNTGVQPANGSTLSTWVNKSGSGTGNATANNPITYSTSGINGLPTLDFTNTQSFTGAVSNTNSTISIFVVCRMDSPSAITARLITMGGYTNPSYMEFYRGNSTGFQGLRSGTTSVSANPAELSIPYLFQTWYTGTTNYNKVCQGETTIISSTPSTGAFNISAFGINKDAGSTNGITGSIAEIIIYNTSVSDTERQYIEGYLSQKWKLLHKLKSDHPYYISTGTVKTTTGNAPTNLLLTASGNVGINTLIPKSTLDVSGNCQISGNLVCASHIIVSGTNSSLSVYNISFIGTINGISAAIFSSLSGVSTNIQTQLNAKAPLASPIFTGIATADTAAVGTSTTQIATTAFVINQGYATVSSLSGYANLSATSQSFSGVQTITNATNSTAATNGALVVTGGVGISGNLVLGGGLVVPSILQIGETVTLIAQSSSVSLSQSFTANAQLNYITGATVPITTLTITNIPTTAQKSYTFVYVISTTIATVYITASTATIGSVANVAIKSSIANLSPTAYIIQSITFINISNTVTPSWIGFTSAYSV